MSVRVRMAPSPTGLLHIGGVRTFLFNWLFARGQGGECLLRIENTDTSREVAESVEQIERSLRWLGIEWDGDTTFQLDVMERAKAEAQRLVSEGAAYEDDGAIRIRMPDDGSTGWDDAIKGRIEVPNAELEDVVLVRSDGRPTYNFASPLEDWLDGITHVIRGDDHVSNTPKQINVLRALGAEPPVYAHVPSVFGADGKKLSKRHGAVSVDEFRADGYVAEALMNFLALLGWAPDGETTIMSADELVERFSLDRVGSSPATFDYAKLDWMNGVYLRALPPDEYAARLVGYLREQGLDWPEERVRAAAPIVQEKIGRFGEFPGFAGFLFHDVEPDPALLDARILSAAAEALGGVDPWTTDAIESCAQAALRRPRGEAAHRLPADSRRCDRLSRLTGSLREPRAARSRHGARAASGGSGGGGLSDFRDLVGTELGPTSWLDVTQERIDAFAAATDDPQWIHVDPERAAAGPVRDHDRARLPDALVVRPDALRGAAAGRRVRRELRVEPRPLPGARSVRKPRSRSVPRRRRSTRSPRGDRAVIEATVECEGVEKPVCVPSSSSLTVSLTPSIRTSSYGHVCYPPPPHAPPSDQYCASARRGSSRAGVFVATAAALAFTDDSCDDTTPLPAPDRACRELVSATR